MAKENSEVCCHGGRKGGAMMLLLGVLILLNAYYYPNGLSWPMFIGVIVAIKGLIKILMPLK